MKIKLRRRNAAVVITTSFVFLLVAVASLGLINVTPRPPSSENYINVDFANLSVAEQRSAKNLT